MPRPIRLRLSAGAAVLAAVAVLFLSANASDRCDSGSCFRSRGASTPCPSGGFVVTSTNSTLCDGQLNRRHGAIYIALIRYL